MDMYYSIAALAVLGLILVGLTVRGVMEQGELDGSLLIIITTVLVLVAVDKVYASALLEVLQ